MPEGLEAEIWRSAAAGLVGRTVREVWVDERVAPPGLAGELIGGRLDAVERIGKILVLHLSHDHPASDPRASTAHSRVGSRRLGLHFGMTGRLVVDGRAPIEQLTYASRRDDASWDRLRLWTTEGADGAGPGDRGDVLALRLNDPRRLGRLSLDEDLSALGPDVLAIDRAQLGVRLARRRTAVKAALLDQGVVAGLGNLTADEVLWWAGVAPRRPADTLDDDELDALHVALATRLPVMLASGGSTTGVLTPDVRAACPPCGRDGTPLRRSTVGGRTAVWCPEHQR